MQRPNSELTRLPSKNISMTAHLNARKSTQTPTRAREETIEDRKDYDATDVPNSKQRKNQDAARKADRNQNVHGAQSLREQAWNYSSKKRGSVNDWKLSIAQAHDSFRQNLS